MTVNDLHVFLATYNRPALMARQLDSLLAQTMRPEVITVLDNGDDPRTREQVELRAALGARYVNTHALGVRGNGIELKRRCGTSGYVACFHDDDRISPMYFEYVVKTVNAHPGVSLVVGNARVCPTDKMDFPTALPHGRGLLLDGRNWAMLMFNCGACKYPFAIYRADVYAKLDIFTISDSFGRAGDIAVLLRAVGADGAVAFLTYPFCVYGIHQGQDSNDESTLPSAACYARLFGEFHRFMGDDLSTLSGFSYVFKCHRKLCSAYKRRCRRDISYREYLRLARSCGALPRTWNLFWGISNHLTQHLLDAYVEHSLFSRECELTYCPGKH